MIKFPSLNISFNINSIAFKIFGIPIYWYAICIISGIILSIFLCAKSKEKFGIDFDFIFTTLFYILIIGVIGARMYYVLFNLEFYKTYPLKIFNIRDGGLAIYGGLITGVLLIIIRCKKFNINPLDFLDYFVPFVSLAQSIGRWGNFFNIEAYGTQTTNFFRMGINTLNGYEEVHPAFLYESIATMIIFIILRNLQRNRKFKGEILYFYLFFYGGIRMFIESVRIDSLMLYNFRISQVLSIAIFVVSSILLLKNYRKDISNRKKCSN